MDDTKLKRAVEVKEAIATLQTAIDKTNKVLQDLERYGTKKDFWIVGFYTRPGPTLTETPSTQAIVMAAIKDSLKVLLKQRENLEEEFSAL